MQRGGGGEHAKRKIFMARGVRGCGWGGGGATDPSLWLGRHWYDHTVTTDQQPFKNHKELTTYMGVPAAGPLCSHELAHLICNYHRRLRGTGWVPAGMSHGAEGWVTTGEGVGETCFIVPRVWYR